MIFIAPGGYIKWLPTGAIFPQKCGRWEQVMKELDPLLHSQLRLAIVSLLLSVEEADFVWLKEKTEATSGNLSVQLDKLSEAGYISVRKEIIGKKPRTACSLTKKGRDALDEYVRTLKEYLHME